MARGRAGPAPSAPQPPPEGGSRQGEDEDWTPGPTNIPFGPWLSVAALEVMLLGPQMARWAPPGLGWLVGA